MVLFGREARLRLFALALLLALGIGGGAGRSYPLIAMIGQWLALIVAAIAGSQLARQAETARALRAPIILFGATVLLILLQIVPLPPGLWHALPGRAVVVAIDALLAQAAPWRPLSLTPDATLAMLPALAVPFAAMTGMALVSAADRMAALRLIVIIAAIGAAIGMVQAGLGAGDAPLLYDSAHQGDGIGLFVNRNHQATFLLAAIAIAAIPDLFGRRRAIGAALIAFLTLGVLATRSRTALLLLPLVLLAAGWLIAGGRRAGRSALGLALGYGLGALILSRTDLMQRILARFAGIGTEARYQYWDNSWFVVRGTFPWGTGLGSFDRVYRTVEPLAEVGPLTVNHAHNDALEWLMEAGLAGALLMIAGLVVLIVMIARAWRRTVRDTERKPLVAAVAALAMILLFSLVDYPLRMPAIAGLAGAMVAVIAMTGRAPSVRAQGGRIALYASGAVALLIGLVATGDGLAQALVARRQPLAATRVAPWSSAAWTALADATGAGHGGTAMRAAATRALAISPLDAGAVRAQGYADLLNGAPKRGAALLRIGAGLGWQDTLIARWLAQTALTNGDATLAAQQIDAMLRRRESPEAAMQGLLAVYRLPGGPAALVERLDDRPGWRGGFLAMLADDGVADPARLTGFLRALASAGLAATPAETARARAKLAEHGDMAGARAVWLASGGRGLIEDGGFEALPDPVPDYAIPYGWSAPPLAGVHVTSDERGTEGKGVRIAADGLTSGMALQQPLLLTPGRYRIAVRVRGGGDMTDAPMADGTANRAALVLLCADGTPVMTLPFPGGRDWRALSGAVMVPQGCVAQRIGVVLTAGEGQPVKWFVDTVRIGRVPQA